MSLRNALATITLLCVSEKYDQAISSTFEFYGTCLSGLAYGTQEGDASKLCSVQISF